MKNKQGYLHVYCGEGKGKTSILNGMVLRALGAGWNIKYLRFLKNRPTAENQILQALGVTVEGFYQFSTKFIWDMDETERDVFKQETRIGFEKLKQYLQSDDIDLILVDEILGAVQNQFIAEQELIDALKTRKPHIKVAVSGRYTFPTLIDLADLISEVKPIKHYFDASVASREGIEF